MDIRLRRPGGPRGSLCLRTRLIFSAHTVSSEPPLALCCTIVLPGRKSGFRAGFRPDSIRNNIKVSPPAGLRPAHTASSEAALGPQSRVGQLFGRVGRSHSLGILRGCLMGCPIEVILLFFDAPELCPSSPFHIDYLPRLVSNGLRPFCSTIRDPSNIPLCAFSLCACLAPCFFELLNCVPRALFCLSQTTA
jgi:hypothetical protein